MKFTNKEEQETDFVALKLLLAPEGFNRLVNLLESNDVPEEIVELHRILTNKTNPWQISFAFGLRRLEAIPRRPNEILATYFYLVSELRGVPTAARDLALEAMIYCKNDESVPTWTLSRLHAAFASIPKSF